MPNTALFARALHQLHLSRLLKDPACKDPVLTFIRRSTETKHHHLTTHYRTRAAAQAINAQPLSSSHRYHEYCNKNLRHEHVVPGIVIYEMILRQDEISEVWLHDVLRRFGLRATITLDENAQLEAAGLAKQMPKGFFDPASTLYQNPLARYIHVGLDSALVARPGDAWSLIANAARGQESSGNNAASTQRGVPRVNSDDGRPTTGLNHVVDALIQCIVLPPSFRWSFRNDGITTLHYGANNVVLELRPNTALGLVSVRNRAIALRNHGETHAELTDAGHMPPEILEAFIHQQLAPFGAVQTPTT